MVRDSLQKIAEDVGSSTEEQVDESDDRVIDDEIVLDTDEQLRDVQEEYDGGWDTGQ